MILPKVQPAAGAIRKCNTWKLLGEKISVAWDDVAAVHEISRIGIGDDKRLTIDDGQEYLGRRYL